MQFWADNEQVDLNAFGAVMRKWLGTQGEAEAAINPVHALERGEIEVPHFECHWRRVCRAHGSRVSTRRTIAASFRGLLTRRRHERTGT